MILLFSSSNYACPDKPKTMEPAYISFGKWRGYEIFSNNLENLDSRFQKIIFTQIQLPLEQIRVYSGTHIYALLILKDNSNTPYFIYLKYEFNIDAVGRKGYLGGALVSKNQTLHLDRRLESLDACILIAKQTIEEQKIAAPYLSDIKGDPYCNIFGYTFPERSAFVQTPEKELTAEIFRILLQSELPGHYHKIYFSAFDRVLQNVSETFIDIEYYPQVQEEALKLRERIKDNFLERCDQFKTSIKNASSQERLLKIKKEIENFDLTCFSSAKQLFKENLQEINSLIKAKREELKKQKQLNTLKAIAKDIQKKVQALRSLQETQINDIKREIADIDLNNSFDQIQDLEEIKAIPEFLNDSLKQKKQELEEEKKEKLVSLSKVIDKLKQKIEQAENLDKLDELEKEIELFLHKYKNSSFLQVREEARKKHFGLKDDLSYAKNKIEKWQRIQQEKLEEERLKKLKKDIPLEITNENSLNHPPQKINVQTSSAREKKKEAYYKKRAWARK